MPLLGKTRLNVSRIGLGTVEIGLPGYGIGKTDFPTDAEADYLLRSAVDLGINYIDTARGYGVAEERIGKSGIAKMPGVIIGTKCGQWLKNQPDLHGAELANKIREDIDTSRRLLGQETLQLVQLHIEDPNFTNLDELIDILFDLQIEGAIAKAHIGIASRGQAVPLAAMETDYFNSIQVAYSILDQRCDPRSPQGEVGNGTSVFKTAQQNRVGVINRSVLLKGALTDGKFDLPDQLSRLRCTADQAALIADEAGTPLPNLAIRFALSNPAITTVLIGTRKPTNLRQAVVAADAGPLPADLLTRLYGLAIEDPDQVDPARWPKLT